MLQFVPVLPDEPVTMSLTSITRLAFRNRFTVAEKIGIEIAALDDPAAPPSTRQTAAGIRALLKDIDSATFVDLARDDTRAGVNFLETVGVIADGRADVILDTPVDQSERPIKIA